MTKRKYPPLTDQEEAEIQRQIAADPDDCEPTPEQLVQAKPFAEAFPELAASIKRQNAPSHKEPAGLSPPCHHPKAFMPN